MNSDRKLSQEEVIDALVYQWLIWCKDAEEQNHPFYREVFAEAENIEDFSAKDIERARQIYENLWDSWIQQLGTRPESLLLALKCSLIREKTVLERWATLITGGIAGHDIEWGIWHETNWWGSDKELKSIEREAWLYDLERFRWL